MQFEDILETVGSFGLYQKLLCFILIPLTTGLVGLTYYVQLFILSAPQFFCKQNVPNRENSSMAKFLPTSKNQDEFACNQITEEDIYNISNMTQETLSNDLLKSTQKCTHGWDYEYDSLFPTITSQNNWVCDESWRPYIIVSCFWVGNMIGSWLFGVLSDRFGRKPIVAISIFVYGMAGVISTFVANFFYAFLLLRMVVGACHHTVSHLAFVLVVEYCGVKSRIIPLFTIMMTYTIASIITPLLALIIWDWKLLLLVTSVPNLIIALFYRFLPESPSWMMAVNKNEATACQLDTVAKVNKKSIEKEQLLQKINSISNSNRDDSEDENDQHSSSLINILKFPRLRRNVLVVLLIWMIGCLSYYGHCQNTSNIGSNIFLSFIFGAAIEIPAWSVPFLIEKFGRKKPLTICFLLSGVSGGFYVFLPKHLTTVVFIFALLGRLFITGAYYISLQYCPEIFPTVIRGRGVAMSETFGGVAIFVSPMLVYLKEYQLNLPLMIFSSLSLMGGVLTVLLPETKGKALPQTMLQAELFSNDAEKRKFVKCFNRAKRSTEYEVNQV